MRKVKVLISRHSIDYPVNKEKNVQVLINIPSKEHYQVQK